MGAINHPSQPPDALPLDPIRVFLPNISDAEYRHRNRIRISRNIATAKIPAMTDYGQARQLLWLVVDTATEWMLGPATVEALELVAEQWRRLLIVADTAHMLEALPE
ncbi:hypothetical protein [Sphingobium yanoikuyae]|uniref:Uncharacterized protein n=1 Tax=Sphingobium yanoikuyae TaxID=13690 RepID=A0A9X7YC32_SPHYA|nr:hypothetical protein [Sphingobium yanoikuyae]QNG45009.1 hypothetical protein H3V42_24790 [Sphingobium yanoikuyae]